MKKTNAMRILDKKKISYQPVSYHYDPENLNVAKIATENEMELASIFKTLVLKGDKTGVFVAVVAGDKSLNLKAAAKISGNKKVAMLAIKDLEKTTGYIRGGCCPFGMKKNFPVYVDDTALNFETIYVNAGVRGLLIGIPIEALEKIARATFGDIAVEMV